MGSAERHVGPDSEAIYSAHYRDGLHCTLKRMPGSSTSEKTIDVFIGSAAGGGCDQRVCDSHSTAQRIGIDPLAAADRIAAWLRSDAEQSTARASCAGEGTTQWEGMCRCAQPFHAAPCTESVGRMGVGNVENRTAQTDEPLARVRARVRGLCRRRRSV